MSAKIDLDALRRKIDKIDDQIHDLIMERTEVVKGVRDVKVGQKIKIRPAREAKILYRLIGRHKGPFPKRELVRIWRELIVATLSFEGPFSVAVYMPESEPSGETPGDRRSSRWNMARDHFGSYSQMSGHVTVRRVIEAVRSYKATVGILPLPEHDDEEPWWPYLASEGANAPKIVARLPFAGTPDERGDGIEALVICPVTPEATGRDRTFLAIETTDKVGIDRLAEILKDNSLEPLYTSALREKNPPEEWLYLAEVNGFIAEGDRILDRLAESLGENCRRIMVLGSYGIPLSPDEIDTVSANEE